MTKRSNHDAPGQLSGYLYQVLSALLSLIENRNTESKVCIERFDDVAFVKNDSPETLIQTKHQLNKRGSLTDTSTDLWRTINSWCDSIKNYDLIISDTTFIIITTAQAKVGTAASCLTSYFERNIVEAQRILFEIAETDQGKTNAPFYKNFLSLSQINREELMKNIFIYDKASSIDTIKKEIMHYVRMTTLPQFEDRVYDKLIGWWINHVIQCLVSPEPVFISYRQLQNELFDIGSDYKNDSLPIDVDPYYEPTDEEIEKLLPQDKIFIEQLNLVSISNSRLKRCIKDYYNAYQQRSQWVREHLLYINDLDEYEKTLVDEWERLFFIMQEKIEDYGEEISEQQKNHFGKDLFNDIEQLDIPIRTNVSQPFIMRGTFHELANHLKVGWHTDFVQRLNYLLGGTLNDSMEKTGS
ncbi:hypothetical protein LI951_14855 [Enterococcus sp. BWT-B8]|uniref:ABC-three component system protein n=1 Tax=Enterococcus sp. BWT-B8 TaxID=2885157 RepID=UPI001E384252|nr:ABC-three component system protein [Enterococcus sp. BWT-B8]MCB5953347.1 hypothetical protein [Enterococcus sp. BWT-B8]